MTTSRPPTTEQGKREWIFFSRNSTGGYYPLTHIDVVVIRITEGASITTLRHAVRDPANVMEASAMPEVVETLEKAFFAMGRAGANSDMDHPLRVEWEAARDALALVHPAPAEGDKR